MNQKTKLAASLLILGLLVGCSEEPISEDRTDNPDIAVSTLFTHEGCTVYRFVDGGRNVYYTNCSGEASTNYNCGKGCTKTDMSRTHVTGSRYTVNVPLPQYTLGENGFEWPMIVDQNGNAISPTADDLCIIPGKATKDNIDKILELCQ